MNPVQKVDQKTFLVSQLPTCPDMNITRMSCQAESIFELALTQDQVVTWTFTIVSFAFLIFRLAIRIRAFRKLQIDDYFVIAAWLMFLASAIIWQMKAHIMYLLYDITTGKATFTEEFIQAYSTLMPQITTFSLLFYLCIWSIKFSFLFFFRKLGSGTQVRAHTRWWWAVFGLTIVGLVGSIADFDFKCSLSDITYILGELCSVHHCHIFRNNC